MSNSGSNYPGGLPQSLLALSNMIQEGRHSTSLQQIGTETAIRKKYAPKIPSLFTQQVGFRGDEAAPGPSSLATKPSSQLLSGRKPVSKTGSASDGSFSPDTAPHDVTVDYREFPRILAILKRENKTIADFAAGKTHDPCTSNFDLLTSVLRGNESPGAPDAEDVNTKQQQQQQQQTRQQQQQQQQTRQQDSSNAAASSAGEESHSHSSDSGTGLRLAQYTHLESVPETMRIQSQVAARLLELLSSAKNTLRQSSEQGTVIVDLRINPEHTGPGSGEQRGNTPLVFHLTLFVPHCM